MSSCRQRGEDSPYLEITPSLKPVVRVKESEDQVTGTNSQVATCIATVLAWAVPLVHAGLDRHTFATRILSADDSVVGIPAIRDGSYSIDRRFPDRGIVYPDGPELVVASSDREPSNYSTFMDFKETDRRVFEGVERVVVSLWVNRCQSYQNEVTLLVGSIGEAWAYTSFSESRTPAIAEFADARIVLERGPSKFELGERELHIDITGFADRWTETYNNGVLLFVSPGGPANQDHTHCSFGSVESEHPPRLLIEHENEKKRIFCPTVLSQVTN